jgi:hypothetical protein
MFTATLMNVSGQQIDQFTGFHNIRVSTEQLPAGCYFLRVNGTENTSIIQMMIQH